MHIYYSKIYDILQLHPVFNVVKLLWALEDPIPGWKAHPPLPPEIVDGEEHYIVEWVLDSQLMRGQLQFLVKWEGYGHKENSWVPELDIAAPDKIQEFYNAYPSAPWWICSVAFHSLISHASRMQQTRGGWCQGVTSFLLWRHLRVFPTPTSDTFGILWTPTASEFQRHFRVLPIPSPFQQSPTPPHPLIWTPLRRSLETLRAIMELGRLPWHPILRVKSLR